MATWSDLEALQVSRREESWRLLRRMRSMPPGATGLDDRRRRTFQAALEQAEQFLKAAASVGYDTKPVQVFYGLSQAGRAIAAASERLTGDEWRLTGHGLTPRNTRDQTDLRQVTVEAHRSGSPQAVAHALGGAFLPHKCAVSLEELWPLIPETFAERLPHGAADALERPALRFVSGTDRRTESPWETAALHRVPYTVWERSSLEVVTEWLAGYPTLAGWRAGTTLRDDEVPNIAMDGDSLAIRLFWPRPDGSDVDGRKMDWVRRATPYRRGWWTFPVLTGATAPLHPLLVWWMILLALSSLARYEPESWARMIDVDVPESPAVAVEHLLDTALDVIPELIVEAMPKETYVFAR